MEAQTDLGREVRNEVRRILDNYNGKQFAIAPVKVSTLRAIDKLLNPEPESFEIPVSRCDARPYTLMEEAAVERMQGRVS